jgi:hypothetical protein
MSSEILLNTFNVLAYWIRMCRHQTNVVQRTAATVAKGAHSVRSLHHSSIPQMMLHGKALKNSLKFINS